MSLQSVCPSGQSQEQAEASSTFPPEQTNMQTVVVVGTTGTGVSVAGAMVGAPPRVSRSAGGSAFRLRVPVAQVTRPRTGQQTIDAAFALGNQVGPEPESNQDATAARGDAEIRTPVPRIVRRPRAFSRSRA